MLNIKRVKASLTHINTWCDICTLKVNLLLIWVTVYFCLSLRGKALLRWRCKYSTIIFYIISCHPAVYSSWLWNKSSLMNHRSNQNRKQTLVGNMKWDSHNDFNFMTSQFCASVCWTEEWRVKSCELNRCFASRRRDSFEYPTIDHKTQQISGKMFAFWVKNIKMT